MILRLPKLYRGPPPTIKVTPEILGLVKNIDFSQSEQIIARVILNDLYINKNMTQERMGELFSVQRSTIGRWLRRLNIPIKNRYDVISNSITKYDKTPFSGNSVEKSYLS